MPRPGFKHWYLWETANMQCLWPRLHCHQGRPLCLDRLMSIQYKPRGYPVVSEKVTSDLDDSLLSCSRITIMKKQQCSILWTYPQHHEYDELFWFESRSNASYEPLNWTIKHQPSITNDLQRIITRHSKQWSDTIEKKQPNRICTS